MRLCKKKEKFTASDTENFPLLCKEKPPEKGAEYIIKQIDKKINVFLLKKKI